jgi:hypothetical protein
MHDELRWRYYEARLGRERERPPIVAAFSGVVGACAVDVDATSSRGIAGAKIDDPRTMQNGRIEGDVLRWHKPRHVCRRGLAIRHMRILRSDSFLGLLEGRLTALALAACQTQGSSAPQKPSIQATVTRKGRPRLPAIKARPCPPSSSPSLPPSVARASSLQALVVLQWVVPKCHMKLREQATHITNVSKWRDRVHTCRDAIWISTQWSPTAGSGPCVALRD